jgi:long-chain-fatty-acid--CoA ligase ACSBG
MHLPCISNAILIGDKRKFITVFLTIKVEMDNDTPTNKLTPTAIEWCKEQGCPSITTVDDILKSPDAKIMGAIQAGIDRANKSSVSNAARVQRWTILPTDLSIPGAELGPTLKLKRFYFYKKYADAIERFYD